MAASQNPAALSTSHLPDPPIVSARVLVVCAALLMMLGLMMLFSTGIGYDDPYHYVSRQALFSLVALLGGILAAAMPYHLWKPLLKVLAPVCIVLLIVTRLIGVEINGSHRWLRFGSVSLQPSELAKLTMILWLAVWVSYVPRRTAEFWKGFVIPCTGMAVLCGAVLVAPDLGTTALLGLVGLSVLYLAGTRFLYLAGSAGLAIGLVAFYLQFDEERMSRVTSFLNPELYESDAAYQLMAGLYALIMGGASGVGFGQSLQKYSYLPEAHTDFILAIIGEELGIAGTLAILLIFAVFFFCGMRIAWRAPDLFGRMLGFGITLMISLQAAINIGVVTASMPTKGLPLPFVSYGGSSLVVTVLMVGILVSIARHNSGNPLADPRNPVRDSRHWL